MSKTRMQHFHWRQNQPRPRPFHPDRTIHRAVALLALYMAGCQAFPRDTGAHRPASASPLATQAVQTLEYGLANPDPRVRSSAIESIVQARYTRLMPQVKRSMRDPVVPVRFAALMAIGDLRYSLAQRDVQQIFQEEKENPSVRLAAAYALDRLGQSQFASYYYDAISSADMTIRANSALLMGKSGNTNTLEGLYWALEDQDSDNRVLQQAIESIAMLGDHRIYQKLWTGLISAYADDRINSIRAMGALGIEPAKQALITMLDDSTLEVRLAAAEQLGRLGDPAGQNSVKEAFKPDQTRGDIGEVRVKVMAAMAIGEIDTASLAQYLPRLLDDPSPFVKIAAARAVLRRKMK